MYTYFLGVKTFDGTKFWMSWTAGRLRQPPDKNLAEFRSETASRMADLIERGGAYMDNNESLTQATDICSKYLLTI